MKNEDFEVTEAAFLAELRRLMAMPVVAVEDDPPTERTVWVRRHWSEPNAIEVPIAVLRDFHWRSISGGVGVRSPRPFLHARMWCNHIPEDSYFPHSCRHGTGPHEILVCIVKKDNTKEAFEKCARGA